MPCVTQLKDEEIKGITEKISIGDENNVKSGKIALSKVIRVRICAKRTRFGQKNG